MDEMDQLYRTCKTMSRHCAAEKRFTRDPKSVRPGDPGHHNDEGRQLILRRYNAGTT